MVSESYLQMGSAVLAHFLLKEKLGKMGILGCLLCVVGSVVIVLHAPQEESIDSVEEIWELATQPGMLHIFSFFLVVKCLSSVIPTSSPDWFICFFSPAFLLYVGSVVAVALVLILYCAPRYGQTNIMIYIGICSVIGSLTVSICGSTAHFFLTFWIIPMLF